MKTNTVTFEELWKYRGALGSYLQHKHSPQDIEDVLQETFLMAWNEIDRYNPEKGGIYTWLLTICKGRLRLSWKQHTRRNGRELPILIDAPDHMTPYEELRFKEAVMYITPDMFADCENSRQRMRRVRAQRKYIKEVIL